MKFKMLLIIMMLCLVAACLPKKEQVICTEYTSEDCPNACVVCPPCAACSSISCQTEEFCQGIGFNRSWYEEIKARLTNK